MRRRRRTHTEAKSGSYHLGVLTVAEKVRFGPMRSNPFHWKFMKSAAWFMRKLMFSPDENFLAPLLIRWKLGSLVGLKL